jgi:hypothetical protein
MTVRRPGPGCSDFGKESIGFDLIKAVVSSHHDNHDSELNLILKVASFVCSATKDTPVSRPVSLSPTLKPSSQPTTIWLAGLIFVTVFVAGVGLSGTPTKTSPAQSSPEPLSPSEALADTERPSVKPAEARPKISPPKNCTEARGLGIAPMYRGEPGYGEWMDGDGDGIACEPHR